MVFLDQIKIGRFIARLRKEQNMTHLNLAEKLGVTDRAISKWENGRGLPDVSLMKPLCEILGITVTELLNGERAEATVSLNKVEETVYEVLTDREIQIKNTERMKKKYSALRVVTIIFGTVIGLVLALMVFSGLRGEGYSIYTAIQTQKAKIVSRLIVEEDYEKVVKYIGFSRSDTDIAKENWVTAMESLGKKIEIENIEITPIILDDYFPMGTYRITVYDRESQVSHIYEGLVTYQNGGITFGNVNIPNGSTDARRDVIGYMLNNIFATYDPG